MVPIESVKTPTQVNDSDDGLLEKYYKNSHAPSGREIADELAQSIFPGYRRFMEGYTESMYRPTAKKHDEKEQLRPGAGSASSILDHFREKARLIPKPNSDPDRASYIARYIASRGKTTHWEDDSAARRATLRLRGALRSRNRPQTVPSEPHEAAPEGCSVLEAIPPRNDRKRSSVTRASFDDSVKSREGWASERSRSVERRGSRYNSLPGGVNPEFRRRYRKDACEALRILVLGSQNSEGDPPPVCSDHIGTRQDVARLHELWAPLDPNDKGQIPSLSFVERFDAHRSTRVLAIRVVTCLTESHPSSSINLRLNDVILLMWPRAGPEEFDTILQWLREFRSYEKRVATPPVISRKVWRELVENFRYIDSDKHGTIQLEELLEANILGPDEVQELIDRYDADGDGEINEFEFLTTLCPDGYRAHPTSRKCLNSEGDALVFIDNDCFTGWLPEDDLPL